MTNTSGTAAAIAPEPFDGSGPVAIADDVTTLADLGVWERQRAIAERVGKNAKKALRKPNSSGTYVARDRDQK